MVAYKHLSLFYRINRLNARMGFQFSLDAIHLQISLPKCKPSLLFLQETLYQYKSGNVP
jgi:hypothetical protein